MGNPQEASQKEAQTILQKLNTFKQQFNSAKGQADGMLSDAISQVIQNCANELARILQEKQGLVMRCQSLEAELKKKIPDPIKKIPDLETDVEPEPE